MIVCDDGLRGTLKAISVALVIALHSTPAEASSGAAPAVHVSGMSGGLQSYVGSAPEHGLSLGPGRSTLTKHELRRFKERRARLEAVKVDSLAACDSKCTAMRSSPKGCGGFSYHRRKGMCHLMPESFELHDQLFRGFVSYVHESDPAGPAGHLPPSKSQSSTFAGQHSPRSTTSEALVPVGRLQSAGGRGSTSSTTSTTTAFTSRATNRGAASARPVGTTGAREESGTKNGTDNEGIGTAKPGKTSTSPRSDTVTNAALGAGLGIMVCIAVLTAISVKLWRAADAGRRSARGRSAVDSHTPVTASLEWDTGDSVVYMAQWPRLAGAAKHGSRMVQGGDVGRPSALRSRAVTTGCFANQAAHPARHNPFETNDSLFFERTLPVPSRRMPSPRANRAPAGAPTAQRTLAPALAPVSGPGARGLPLLGQGRVYFEHRITTAGDIVPVMQWGAGVRDSVGYEYAGAGSVRNSVERTESECDTIGSGPPRTPPASASTAGGVAVLLPATM